ncbi:hypothetical protein RJ641_032023, partial [Dillenia turbinata]
MAVRVLGKPCLSPSLMEDTNKPKINIDSQIGTEYSIRLQNHRLCKFRIAALTVPKSNNWWAKRIRHSTRTEKMKKIAESGKGFSSWMLIHCVTVEALVVYTHSNSLRLLFFSQVSHSNPVVAMEKGSYEYRKKVIAFIQGTLEGSSRKHFIINFTKIFGWKLTR